MHEEKIKVESLDIIVTIADGKPYYSIKYKEVGNRHYNVGYSSFNLDFVIEWRKRYFEVAEAVDAKETNVGNKWTPVEWHELTEEEKTQYRNTDAVEYMLDCKLPEDSEEIIVTDGKRTWTDINGIDDFYYLESGNDWRDMKAWMPLPEPYKQNDEGAEK